MAVPAVFALGVAVVVIAGIALMVSANRRREHGVNAAQTQTSGDTSYPTMFMGDSSSGAPADCADGSTADSGGCDGGGGDGGGGGGD